MTALKLAPAEPDIHDQARQAGAELQELCLEVENLEAASDEAESAFATSPNGKTLEAKAVTAQLAANAKKKLEERRPEFQKLFDAAQRATLESELAALRKRIVVRHGGIPVALAAQHEKLESVIAEFRKSLKGALTDLREGVARVNAERQQAQDLADRLRTGENFAVTTAAPVIEAVIEVLRDRTPAFPTGNWIAEQGMRLTVADGAYNFQDTIVDFRMKFAMADRSFQ